MSLRSKPKPPSLSGRGRLALLLALSASVGLYCGTEPRQAERAAETGTAETVSTSASLSSSPASSAIPQALRAKLLRDRQSEAAELPAYHFASDGRARIAHHDGQGYQARIARDGVAVTVGAESLRLTLSSAGCGDTPEPPVLTSERHRAELRRSGLVEWYENGPMGLEQGFTVAARPECRERASGLRVEMAISGTLQARSHGAQVAFVSSAGKDVLHYGELFAADAAGKALPAQLEVSPDGRHLALSIDDRDARYPIAIDPLMWTEQQKLVASDKAANDNFASSVSVSADGNTALIGAWQADPGGTANAGAAYVYTRSAGVWTEQQKLVASDKVAGDFFGSSVSVSADGNTAIIGAYRADPGGTSNAGAAYVFTRSAGVWTEQQKLVASDKAVDDLFGFSASVSADGNTAIIGAHFADPGGTSNAGAAYVFTRSAGVWTEQQKLVASDKAASDLFGQSVSLSADGSTALIGALQADPGGTTDAGAAYVFTRSAGLWTEQQKLVASDNALNDFFGVSVSVSADGNTALIGAYAANPGGTGDAGAAYVFTRSTGVWTQQQKLVASDKAASDNFGFSVSVSGDSNTALIGAVQASPGGTTFAGAAYVFTRSAGVWTEQQKLVASDKAVADIFGVTVSLSGDGNTALIGARLADPGATSSAGAAYVFGPKTNGTACSAGAECLSGSCVDGVCCDTACGGGVATDCQSCLAAQTGGTNGTCGTITAAAAFTCRGATDLCDLPALCDGTNTACPANPLKSNSIVCRPKNGACDVAENCTGSSAACPMNAFQSSATVCRPSAGPCDIAETCTGAGPDCPGDALKSSTTVCRSAAGACDLAELCTGSSVACPRDALKPAGTTCKVAGASATCDPADSCDGIRTSCPANFAPYGTACGTNQSCNGTGRCL
ncbi:MAG TPA: hypothetical protein PKI03_09960 [Pseudomonadota bacterium]|nr:hypothetical protein [Pseudomonadota bacterium]